jgi:sulfite reductase (NADPH) hemoprotein beta-component
MYGATYLPRKFKTGFALPPSNDVDLFSQDLGFIAIVESGRLMGYNVVVGGGQGMSHGNVETYSRDCGPVGFITPEQSMPSASGADHPTRSWRPHQPQTCAIEVYDR